MDDQMNNNNNYNNEGNQNPNFTMGQDSSNGEAHVFDAQNTNNANEDTTYHMSGRNQEIPNATYHVDSQQNQNTYQNQSYQSMNNQTGQNTNAQASGSRPYVTYGADSGNSSSGSSYQQGTTSGAYQQNAANGSYQQGTPYRAATYHTQAGAANPKKKKSGNGTAKKAVKFVGGAVAFGAIAGCIMFAVNVGFGHITGKRSGNASLATTAGVSDSGVKKTSSSSSGSSVSTIVNDVMPSIVSITSTFKANGASNFNDFYYWFYGGNNKGSSEQTGSGSGIIISETDDELMVVTNNHVISDESYGDATKVQVTFSDDSTVNATVKGKDSDADLAVLMVKKSDLNADQLKNIKIAVLGSSDNMKVGDDVIAIGNALGYGQSVTTGVVSALNREVQLTDKTMTLLQTDAAINPGNSGGALLNMNGEVIGINSVKYSSDEVEGMGYAIPMAIAKPIIEELMNEKEVAEKDQAYLGIYGTDVSSDLASAYNMPEGVWVSSVTDDSPAVKGGIQQRDIITKFNEHKISSMNSLQEQIAKKAAGTEVTITVQRQASNGEYKEVKCKVTLGKKSEASQSTQNQESSGENDSRKEPSGSQNDSQSGFDDFFTR